MDALRNAFTYFFARERGLKGHFLARWLFLRMLGVVYFSAFFALLFQITGLIGPQGIQPAQHLLTQLQQLPLLTRLFYAPTILWFSTSNQALMALAWTGLAASILVMLNRATRPALTVCWLAYLSFIAVSQEFGQYQSDGMLLEAGFLSLFIAPKGLTPRLGRTAPPVRAAYLLLLFEWFRIYFQSGAVKLLSGDPTWRNLTAMYEYYQNGPLPTWIGWYLQHLPHWFHVATAGATLFMELALVWLAVVPHRRARIVCFWIVTPWQLGVILTANYAFLNYLVLFLGILLLDDQYLIRFTPRRWDGELTPSSMDLRAGDGPAPAFTYDDTVPLPVRTLIFTTLAAIPLLLITYSASAQLLLTFNREVPIPRTPIELLEPFRIANTYGLFAVMTPHRYEIEFQGSNDNQLWLPYRFRYKPQDLHERPGIYAPYQPRFDWNLWFASLAPWQQSPIVPLAEERLLDNSSSTLQLLGSNPFPEHAPAYVRAVLYQYWFSSAEEKRATGDWWRRQYLGTFAPTLEKLPNGQYGEIAEPQLNGPPPDTTR